MERSTIRNRSRTTDTGRPVIRGLLPGLPRCPVLAYSYSYDVKGRNERLSAFAQDQWQMGRLTVNAGLRMDSIKGKVSSQRR